jgi:hypothetical protein
VRDCDEKRPPASALNHDCAIDQFFTTSMTMAVTIPLSDIFPTYLGTYQETPRIKLKKKNIKYLVNILTFTI